MNSKFEDYLDLITNRNSSDIDNDGNYPCLYAEELEELCCLFAVEDKKKLGDSDYKDEILGPNYNDYSIELTERLARLCCSDNYCEDEEIEDNIERLREIATKAFVSFYEQKVTAIYDSRMQYLLNNNDEEE